MFTIEDRNNLPYFTPVTENILEDLTITVDTVTKKLKDLKVNKSQGPDGIHPRVLHELRDEIALPLTIIYNSSLTTAEVPQV